MSPGFHHCLVNAVLTFDHCFFTVSFRIVQKMACQSPMPKHFPPKFLEVKKKTSKKCQVGKSVAWLSVAICIWREKGKIASHDLQYFPCFHASLNKDILIIELGSKWTWWSYYILQGPSQFSKLCFYNFQILERNNINIVSMTSFHSHFPEVPIDIKLLLIVDYRLNNTAATCLQQPSLPHLQGQKAEGTSPLEFKITNPLYMVWPSSVLALSMGLTLNLKKQKLLPSTGQYFWSTIWASRNNLKPSRLLNERRFSGE